MWPFDGTPPTQGFNQNQGQAPMGQNPLVKPQRTSFGGNKPWLAGANNFANMLTALQNMPKKPMGAPNPTQGSPGMGGMPPAPPDPTQGSPGAGGMPAAPVGGIPSPPPMAAAPPVPFGGMNGPGMGNMGMGDPSTSALMSQPPGQGFNLTSLFGQGGGF
jgi:hypothetical protein